MKRMALRMIAMIAIFAVGMASAAPAAAPDKEGGTLVTHWQVVPLAELPAARDVPHGNLMLKQEIRPKGMIALQADLVDKDYGVTVPAGNQMFLVDSDVPGVYCTFDLKIGKGTIMLHGMGGYPQLCAADVDNDGKLDSVFYKTAMPGMPPIIFGSRRPFRSLPPTAYGAISPDKIIPPLFVGIGYGGPRGWDKRLTFAIIYGSQDEKSFHVLSNYILAPNKIYPLRMSILGAAFTVESVGEKGSGHISVQRTMPAQDIVLGVQ